MQQTNFDKTNSDMLSHIEDSEELVTSFDYSLYQSITGDDFREIFIAEVAKITKDEDTRKKYLDSWDNSTQSNAKIIFVDWEKRIVIKPTDSIQDLTREKLWNEVFSIQRKNEISETRQKFQTQELEPVWDEVALKILSTYEADIDAVFIQVGQLINRNGWSGNEASQLYKLVKLYKASSVDLDVVLRNLGPILLEEKTKEDLISALGGQYPLGVEA